MKNIDKKAILIPASLILVLIALMIVGTFFDLQISNALVDLKAGNYYTTNLFGRFFETIGETPIYLITAFSSAVIFHNFKRRGKSFVNIFFCVLSTLVSVGMLYYMSYKLFKYISIHFGFNHLLGGIGNTIAYGLLGAGFTFLLFYLTRKLPSSFLNKLLAWAFVVWGTALISQVITHNLKSLAARPRFRAMHVLGDFDLYRKWFEFQFEIPKLNEDWVNLLGASSDWFKSFPSGHTSAGALIITLTAIPSLFEKLNNKKTKILTFVCVSLFVASVMLSRIVVGAHFLTDVTFGCFTTIVSYYLAKLIVKIILSKITVSDLKEREKPCLIEESEI